MDFKKRLAFLDVFADHVGAVDCHVQLLGNGKELLLIIVLDETRARRIKLNRFAFKVSFEFIQIAAAYLGRVFDNLLLLLHQSDRFIHQVLNIKGHLYRLGYIVYEIDEYDRRQDKQEDTDGRGQDIAVKTRAPMKNPRIRRVILFSRKS